MAALSWVWAAKDVLSNQTDSKTKLLLNLDANLHSTTRRLIELRMEHADLDAMIDRIAEELPLDELMLRRLKKRRLGLRDEMARLERSLSPDEPA